MPNDSLALRPAQWTEEQKKLIKDTVAPDASDAELAMFLHVAQVAGLDPLQKQIWFVKRRAKKLDAAGEPITDSSGRPIWETKVTIMAAADGLQARALRFPDCQGIRYAAVFDGDDFLVDRVTGQVVKHLSNPFKAGTCLGAWGCVDREGKAPFFVVVKGEEYVDKRSPLWKGKPVTMIEKVARATACRRAYPENFGGIYDPAEIQEDPDAESAPSEPASVPVVERPALSQQRAAAQAKAPDDPSGMTDPPDRAAEERAAVEKARLFARDARDVQTRSDALATGIAPESYRAWVEKVLGRPVSGETGWNRTLSDVDRDALELAVQERREAGAGAPEEPPPKAPPKAKPAPQKATGKPALRSVPVDTVQRTMVVTDADGSTRSVTTSVPV